MKIQTTIWIEEELRDEVRKREWVLSNVVDAGLRMLMKSADRASKPLHARSCETQDPEETAGNAYPESRTQQNAEKVVLHLVSAGMTRTDSLSLTTLNTAISVTIGTDPRTKKRYSEFLIKNQYLVPVGNGLLRLGPAAHPGD